MSIQFLLIFNIHTYNFVIRSVQLLPKFIVWVQEKNRLGILILVKYFKWNLGRNDIFNALSGYRISNSGVTDDIDYSA